MSELPTVTPEFLSLELSKTIQKSERKGGPYSKHSRYRRQEQVFKMHFENGFSIIKIAEILKINRHTIARDIKLGYDKLSEQLDFDIESLIMKQVYRLDIQRTELLEQLSNQNGFQERLILRKMIIDIDSKIAQIITKSTMSLEHVLNGVSKIIEMFERNPDQKQHWISTRGFSKVSTKTKKKINELIKEDLQDPENYLEENEDESEENEV